MSDVVCVQKPNCFGYFPEELSSDIFSHLLWSSLPCFFEADVDEVSQVSAFRMFEHYVYATVGCEEV